MHPKQLVGKNAIRTKEATYAHGVIDRSMMTDKTKILAVTDSHMVVETYYRWNNEPHKHILSYEWIDNNWTSYDDLMQLAEPKLPVKLAIKFQKLFSILQKWFRSFIKKLHWIK